MTKPMTSQNVSAGHQGMYPPRGESYWKDFLVDMAARLERIAEQDMDGTTVRELRDMARECRVAAGL